MITRIKALVFIWSALVYGVCAGAQSIIFDFDPEHINPVRPWDQPGVLSAFIGRSPLTPAIDGSTDERAWEGAAALKTFGIPRPPTVAWLSYDDDYLYLRVYCGNTPGFEPAAEKHERNNAMRGEDHVHFVIKPFPDRDDEFLFKLNMAGSVYDAHDMNTEWNADWRHAVRRGDEGWYAEAAVPWKIFGMEQPPARLGFNVGRAGNGVIIRSWNNMMHYSAAASVLILDTDQACLRADGDRMAPATSSGRAARETGAAYLSPVSTPNVLVQGNTLVVELDRDTARVEDRWVEALLTLQPSVDLDDTQIEAVLYPFGGGAPLETAVFTPTAERGRLSVDMRALNHAQAELTVALYEKGEQTSVARMFISALAGDILSEDQRVEIILDIPEIADIPAQWPVTFGVPFPRGALWNADNLRLVDKSGAELPSQAEVTGLWARDGAIQWVRFDALVEPGAGCFLEFKKPSVKPDLPVTINEEEGGRLRIDTGAAVYVLARGSSPVAEIWRDKRKIAFSAGVRGLYVVDRNGRVGIASADGQTMEIESAGPVSVSVRFEGYYMSEDGAPMARHITRIELFAGMPFADITHTLVITENTNETWFREIGWEFGVAPGENPSAFFNVERADPFNVKSCELAKDETACMFQESHRRFGGGEDKFFISAGDKVLHEGKECGDWAMLAGSDGGLMFSCSDAARRHPKEFDIGSGKFNLKLFSNRAGEELDFRGATLAGKWNLSGKLAEQVAGHNPDAAGWSKTHELLIVPLPSGSGAQAGLYPALRANPVYALADPEWIYSSDAMGPLYPRDVEKYPELEKLIDDLFEKIYPRGYEAGHFGFMDYYAGPTYSGSPGFCGAGRYRFTYGLRHSIWLAYARSGDRRMRAFAEGSNKAFLDNYLVHWDTPEKVRGLYTSGGDRPLTQLPFYWGRGHAFNISSSSNLDQFLWLYQLTGYRRAKDAVEQFGEGLVRAWRHDMQNWRQLMVFRMLVQTYRFTWGQRLRALAEGTFDSFVDPEGEVMLTKNRPYISSTYKTDEDLRALVEAWQVFGESKYLDVAIAVALNNWRNEAGNSPVGRMPGIAYAGCLLYRETGMPAVPASFESALLRAGSASAGLIGTSGFCSVLETVPYLMGVLGRYEKPGGSLPWIAYRDYGEPGGIVAWKRRDDILDFTVVTPRSRTGLQFALQAAGVSGGWGRGQDTVVQHSSGAGFARVPKDSPAGAYQIVPSGSGHHFVTVDTRVPMVLHAPDYWQLPDLTPAQPVYFKLPPGLDGPQILFEGRARLYDPDGTLYSDPDGVSGWVDLPDDMAGLWRFEPLENRLVRARNFPPFFAFGDPFFFFEPPIEWNREKPVVPAPEIPDEKVYVPGAIEEEESLALYLAGSRTFHLESGPSHPEDKGGWFLPYESCTVEFYFRPRWNTFDLGSGASAKPFLTINHTGSYRPWQLVYRVDPEGTTVNLGPREPSHSLFGSMHTEGNGWVRVWRTRTLFERDEWTHVAWSWGPETLPDARGEPVRLMTMRIFVNGVGSRFVNFPQHIDRLAGGVPEMLRFHPVDGAIDQLRVSDIQRYTGDFAPPSRDRALRVDEHTRALFHFNGTLEGESYGADVQPVGVVKP